MLDEKAWFADSALIHPKGVLWGWGQDSTCRPVKFFIPNLLMFLWPLLYLWTDLHSCWNRKEPLTKLGAWNVTLRVPFTETKRLSTTPEKQPLAIISLCFKLYTRHNQSDKYCSSGNRQTQTHSWAMQTEKRNSSFERTRLHWSSGRMLYTQWCLVM